MVVIVYINDLLKLLVSPLKVVMQVHLKSFTLLLETQNWQNNCHPIFHGFYQHNNMSCDILDTQLN